MYFIRKSIHSKLFTLKWINSRCCNQCIPIRSLHSSVSENGPEIWEKTVMPTMEFFMNSCNPVNLKELRLTICTASGSILSFKNVTFWETRQIVVLFIKNRWTVGHWTKENKSVSCKLWETIHQLHYDIYVRLETKMVTCIMYIYNRWRIVG